MIFRFEFFIRNDGRKCFWKRTVEIEVYRNPPVPMYNREQQDQCQNQKFIAVSGNKGSDSPEIRKDRFMPGFLKQCVECQNQ